MKKLSELVIVIVSPIIFSIALGLFIDRLATAVKRKFKNK